MEKKAKIAVIASMGPRPYVGGIENVIDTLVNSSLKKSYDFEIFDTYRKPDTSRTGINKAFFACNLFFACSKFLRTWKPDIVHIHFCSNNDFRKHTICLVAARLCGVKTIFHLHGGSFDKIYRGYRPITQALVRSVFTLPHRVIALSEYWADFLAVFMSRDRLRIINNPVNCENFLPLNDGSEIEKEKKKILLLGSVGKRKGHYDVVDAMPTVLKKHPSAIVLFAGPDETHGATEELKRIVLGNGLHENVFFLGPVTGQDKIDLLHSCSLMILPSHGENMPISVMEGMAARLPVLASTVGALPELLENGKLGILVSPGEHEELAQGIIRALDSPGEMQAMALGAYKKIKNKYDINCIRDQLDVLYSELLNPQIVSTS